MNEIDIDGTIPVAVGAPSADDKIIAFGAFLAGDARDLPFDHASDVVFSIIDDVIESAMMASYHAVRELTGCDGEIAAKFANDIGTTVEDAVGNHYGEL